MNGAASDTIAAAIEVLTFFFGRDLHFILYSSLNYYCYETDYKNDVAYNGGPQKFRFAKRGLPSKRLAKKGSVKLKVWEIICNC